LAVVEDVRDPHAHHPSSRRLTRRPVAVARRGSARAARLFAAGVLLVDPAGDRGEDLDALLAVADLPAQGLPGPVAGDVAGIGALSPDREGVVQGVVMKRGRGA